LDALDSREAEARLAAVEAHLRTLETRLGAMEGAIGALAAGLAQPRAAEITESSAS
jgi:hypothetical protein